MEVQILEDLNLQVLRGFGLNAIAVYKLNPYYICHTSKGIKAVRKVKDSIQSIEIQSYIKNYLYNKGFYNVDKFYLSKYNKPYYIFNNNIYVVTDFIDNQGMNFNDNTLFLNLIKGISKMHSSLKNIYLSSYSLPYGQDLSNKYNKALQMIYSIKKNINNQSRLSDFDVIFIKNYSKYIDDISKSIVNLKETNYDLYKNTVIKENCICHNSLKKENILIDEGMIYITNFSSCTIDSNLIDLSNIIKTYLKHIDSNPLNISDIINTYSKYNSLQLNEIKILYVLLLYPSKFIKTCHLYYFKQKKLASSSMVNKLDSIVNQRDFLHSYISTIKI